MALRNFDSVDDVSADDVYDRNGNCRDKSCLALRGMRHRASCSFAEAAVEVEAPAAPSVPAVEPEPVLEPEVVEEVKREPVLWVHLDDRVTLAIADCRHAMAEMEPNSIDAIVCDPPYGLEFMGKGWDHGVPGRPFWVEAYRVLKPGGFLLAFGGTRTFHRLAVGIEDAGFEIRDCLSWMYGSGFPKSMDVSKAIDKAAGAEREVIGFDETKARPNKDNYGKATDAAGMQRPDTTKEGWKDNGATITAAATPEAEQWEGWGTALKPAWEPIIMARKPFKGTVAANVLEHGTGALNIDSTRVGYTDDSDKASATPQGKVTAKVGALAGGTQNEADRTEFERPEQKGRWPANVLFTHHEDCVQVGTKKVKGITGGFKEGSTGTMGATTGRYGAAKGEVQRDQTSAGVVNEDGTETMEAWECVEHCPVRLLDEQTGNKKSSGIYKGDGSRRSEGDGVTSFEQASDRHRPNAMYADQGGASRFFYSSKVSKKERNAGLPDGVLNDHPTVKPVEVMAWLVRMVTQPGGTVLDPFMGSGSTGLAAIREGFAFVGIDKDEHYANDIAAHRIRAAL